MTEDSLSVGTLQPVLRNFGLSFDENKRWPEAESYINTMHSICMQCEGCSHGSNAIGDRHILGLVDVAFDEVGLRTVLDGQGLEIGSNHLARATPAHPKLSRT